MSLEAWGDENPDDADHDSWADRATDAGWINPGDYSRGAIAILEERQRQETSEGWTLEHDDAHTDESLALVAALYASPMPLFCAELGRSAAQFDSYFLFEDPWPTTWDRQWDRRGDLDRRRLLEIAGALIAAEIDRLDRLPEALRFGEMGE